MSYLSNYTYIAIQPARFVVNYLKAVFLLAYVDNFCIKKKLKTKTFV